MKPANATDHITLPAGQPCDNDLTTDTAQELLSASHALDNKHRQIVLNVPDIRCGSCVNRIEKELARLDHVDKVRVNLTNKRVTVSWAGHRQPPPVLEKLHSLGYTAQLAMAAKNSTGDTALPYLLRALAVAAFASGNIMLLSVSVWSGADHQTKHLFDVLSAAIALPAIAYSGQIFFHSAWQALRHRSTNMDVPISIGILLTLTLSCYNTFFLHATDAVYFEAPVMLIFFLLTGRTLDHLMREKSRNAVNGLTRLQPSGAWIINSNDRAVFHPLETIVNGNNLRISAGDYIPVDCTVHGGTSDVDFSLINGESTPKIVKPGDQLLAGTRNLTAELRVAASATVNQSYLARMISLVSKIENTRSRGRLLADRISTWYAPVIHLAAALSCLAWYLATADLHQSVTIAIAVLIITCPCALGLAVPMVQVVIARRLFSAGIVVKDGSALERLAQVDTIVFDKTGTLTSGKPELLNNAEIDQEAFRLAASIAASSAHPYSKALLSSFCAQPYGDQPVQYDSVVEYAGCGLELNEGRNRYRLGRADWATEVFSETTNDTSIFNADNNNPAPVNNVSQFSATVLTNNGTLIATFLYEDALRSDAASTIQKLHRQGFTIHCLSGDNSDAVRFCTEQLGIDQYRAGLLPAEKVAYLNQLTAAGKKVLMVGDGLNDAPALAAAHVSMAPGSASEVGRNSADLVFTNNKLATITEALTLAQTANKSIKQNLAIALLYNAVALPLAIAGWVTPLLAALAMSGSSIVVMANALRLNNWQPGSLNSKRAKISQTSAVNKVEKYA